MPSLPVFILLLSLFASSFASDLSACDCGYTDPDDPTGQIWNTYWSSDFRQMSASDLTNTFRYMEYTVERSTGAARDFNPSNVAIDSAGLHLTVQQALANGSVPSGGIAAKSTDFGFGVYHVEAQATTVNGTVQAFYVYRDDNNEVDIEYLSMSNPQQVGFSVKPQVYLPNGSPSNTTFSQARPSFDLTAGLHQYSFAWNSTAVAFAIDTNWSSVITTNVPPLPGSLSISHWSDGNPNYSGGPPTSPATILVTRTWAYYNATGVSPPCQTTATACTTPPASAKSKPGVPTTSDSMRSSSLSSLLGFAIATLFGLACGLAVL